MFLLEVMMDSGSAFEREFDCESLTVGRSKAAGLTLSDRFLSREHVRIVETDGAFTVEDLGSRNGTFVNGARIEKVSPLASGDEIRASSCTLIFRLPADRGGSAPTGAKAKASAEGLNLESSVLIPAAELAARHQDLSRTVSSPEGLGPSIEHLEFLDGVHRFLARSISLPDLLDLILEGLFERLSPEEGVVVLAREDGSYERVAERRAPGVEADFLVSKTLIEEVAGKRQGALVLDAMSDERFADAESILASGVRSIVAAPLVVEDRSLGLIAMSSRINVRQFEERDLELLSSLASVAALRLRNVSLAVHAAEKRKLEAEVALARSVQETLLGQTLPEIPGYDVFGLNHPSQGVSGDLYQVLPSESETDFFLFLFDVSGKGLAASLLAATLEALSADPIERNLSPGTIFERLNDQLDQRTLPDRFATAFLGRLDVRTHRLTYANAGHNPVLFVRAGGGADRLSRTGLPLAVLAGGAYPCREVEFSPGDLLVVYSDGLTEAVNPEGEEYGLDRLEAVCLDVRGASALEVAASIEREIAAFAAGRPPGDDQTLVVLRRLEDFN